MKGWISDVAGLVAGPDDASRLYVTKVTTQLKISALQEEERL